MKSKTPITDYAKWAIPYLDGSIEVVESGLCKLFERQRNEAKEEVKELEDLYTKAAADRDHLTTENQTLRWELDHVRFVNDCMERNLDAARKDHDEEMMTVNTFWASKYLDMVEKRNGLYRLIGLWESRLFTSISEDSLDDSYKLLSLLRVEMEALLERVEAGKA